MRILAAVRSAVASALSVTLIAAPVSGQDILLEKGSSPGKVEKAARVKRDHFTKYQPPSGDEIPPDAKVHIIQTGDTLWDLAKTYLGDNYLWPQIWEVNRYITDPHWIYPGDPLVIPQPMLITELRPAEPMELEMFAAPQPVAKRHDVYCAPYIAYVENVANRRNGIRQMFYRPETDNEVRAELVPTYGEAKEVLVRNKKAAKPAKAAKPEKAQKPAKVEDPRKPKQSASATKAKGDTTAKPKKSKEAKPEKIRYVVRAAPQVEGVEDYRDTQADGDVVYINRGEIDGVKAGDEFLIVRPEREVVHPADGARLGIAMQMMGTLKVLCTQKKTATAVILSTCESIELGDLIRILEPIPIPLASEFVPTNRTCVTTSDRPSGYLVYMKHRKVGIAEEELFNIDLGSDAGVVPGDFVTLWRQSRFGDEYPPVILGDAVILLVEKKTATAKVMSSYLDINIGDRVKVR
jgi:nucleoid-associated protein YgaU